MIGEEKLREKRYLKTIRVGRYYTPFSKYSFEIVYANTEHSIDVFLTLSPEIVKEIGKDIAPIAIWELLKKIYDKMKERKKKRRSPLPSDATKESLREERIKIIRILMVRNGGIVESFDYFKVEYQYKDRIK